MKIYTIDKLYEQHMTINRGIQQILQVVIFYILKKIVPLALRDRLLKYSRLNSEVGVPRTVRRPPG